MKRCLQLAKNGIGTTRPNPSVGAVIVHNHTIIGEGYTSPYGGPHAEVNAIRAVKHTQLLSKATLYVTLEPCSHYGKTPPCADLIVTQKIPNVVIGCLDTNALVAGKGIAKLKKAGCNVTVGVLEKECYEHHQRFFTVQNKKRPYIILKWAETNNGLIAPQEKDQLKPVWISNQYSQQLVHKWRSEEHAILVGENTVKLDNPTLNVRSWFGNNPIRVVISKQLSIPTSSHIFNKKIKTIVITQKAIKNDIQIIYEPIDFSNNVARQICDVLLKHNIQSVLVEGGTQTLQTFIDENLWDEARIFIGANEFKQGVSKPNFTGKQIIERNIANNFLRIYRND